MRISQTFRALGPIDARSIIRDPMLRWIVFFPVLIAVVIRWGAPLAGQRLQRASEVDLSPYFPLLMSYVPIMTPMMAGMVIGFLLLDQRDDRTLEALRVTPLSPRGYLVYRLAVPAALSIGVSAAIFPIAGLTPLAWHEILAVSLSAALLAPFYALVLAVLARNKVEGFALTKAMGVLLAIPLLAWFTPVPWQWLWGATPLYWPAKVLWLLDAGETLGWLYVAVGLLCQFVLLVPLVRRFQGAS